MRVSACVVVVVVIFVIVVVVVVVVVVVLFPAKGVEGGWGASDFEARKL